MIVSSRLPKPERHNGGVMVHCSREGRHCELFAYSEILFEGEEFVVFLESDFILLLQLKTRHMTP